MAITELISKLRNKRQVTERSAFQHYLQAIKSLASGEESDADEISHILEVANKSESDLERDVGIQQQRLAWAARCVANQQATKDRVQAERDLQAASAALQEAHDKLMPAIDAAQARVTDANHRHSITHGAESWLAGNLLDVELLQRESVLNDRLREVNQELNPLMQDRGFKQSSLQNAEFRRRQIENRNPDSWPDGFLSNISFWRTKDLTPAELAVADLQNQLAQLEQAIAPRQLEQARLQAELAEIHRQKLLP